MSAASTASTGGDAVTVWLVERTFFDDDSELRERYATEASRMAETHEPNEAL